MNNRNTPTNPQKRNTATLWGIYASIEHIYEIADCSLNGSIAQIVTDEHGQKVKIPLTHKEALDFIIDQATLAMMEIDDLKQQIQTLTIRPEDKAERDCLALPVVDLGGAQ